MSETPKKQTYTLIHPKPRREALSDRTRFFVHCQCWNYAAGDNLSCLRCYGTEGKDYDDND